MQKLKPFRTIQRYLYRPVNAMIKLIVVNALNRFQTCYKKGIIRLNIIPDLDHCYVFVVIFPALGI